ADPDALDAVDQHDVAGAGFGGLLALEAFELQDLVDPRVDRCAVGAAVDGHVLHRPERALVDAADADAAHVGGIVERADLQLQRVGGAAPPRRCGPTRRSPGSPAAPRWRPACRTGRRWR